jgi:PAS domain S-box-containing protein
VSLDVLEVQLATALQRLSALQRRAEAQRGDPKLVDRALEELEGALSQVRMAQERLAESRQRIEDLQAQLAAQHEKYRELFDGIPQPCVVTRADTTITEVNRAASELFNVSQRFLVGKTLSVFVCEDRDRFMSVTGRVARHARPEELRFKLRPRERAPLDVFARVSGDTSALRWVLRPTDTPPGPPAVL